MVVQMFIAEYKTFCKTDASGYVKLMCPDGFDVCVKASL